MNYRSGSPTIHASAFWLSYEDSEARFIYMGTGLGVSNEGKEVQTPEYPYQKISARITADAQSYSKVEKECAVAGLVLEIYLFLLRENVV